LLTNSTYCAATARRAGCRTCRTARTSPRTASGSAGRATSAPGARTRACGAPTSAPRGGGCAGSARRGRASTPSRAPCATSRCPRTQTGSRRVPPRRARGSATRASTRPRRITSGTSCAYRARRRRTAIKAPCSSIPVPWWGAAQLLHSELAPTLASAPGSVTQPLHVCNVISWFHKVLLFSYGS
jgi:hypothetical protein